MLSNYHSHVPCYFGFSILYILPGTIAAAAVYLVVSSAGLPIEIRDIHQTSDIAEATIKNSYGVLLQNRATLLTPEFLKDCEEKARIKKELKMEVKSLIRITRIYVYKYICKNYCSAYSICSSSCEEKARIKKELKVLLLTLHSYLNQFPKPDFILHQNGNPYPKMEVKMEGDEGSTLASPKAAASTTTANSVAKVKKESMEAKIAASQISQVRPPLTAAQKAQLEALSAPC